MTKKHKIPAFTLSEILVVLAITSIVITIAFTVLSLISKQFITMQSRYEERTEVTKFKQRLLFDFEKGSQIFWNEKIQELSITHQDEVTRYEMTSEYVLRDSDTIDLKVLNTQLYYKGDTIEEGIVDGIEIELEATGRAVQFFVSKEIDARQIVQELWD
ncbi:hypothetical protein GCM10011344_27280 [Dokdonia pacifica]|uniref:N-terminal methylation motif-containing protein n=1 Tax=Dokdonia pacifica TaxID=1627892 RepID=A0A239E5E9_9FLAO|nr:prepilin-type N-terminal cleavage/methylation domain-containing protein [Dokdonia pacifica]GGG25140.1 hypothetical protein GCM10011344_27280 [Dokdonia pacifica]SNS39945.1 N-terminal methylation motif-containing protein [Dokdonia pacifica]